MSGDNKKAAGDRVEDVEIFVGSDQGEQEWKMSTSKRKLRLSSLEKKGTAEMVWTSAEEG